MLVQGKEMRTQYKALGILLLCLSFFSVHKAQASTYVYQQTTQDGVVTMTNATSTRNTYISGGLSTFQLSSTATTTFYRVRLKEQNLELKYMVLHRILLK